MELWQFNFSGSQRAPHPVRTYWGSGRSASCFPSPRERIGDQAADCARHERARDSDRERITAEIHRAGEGQGVGGEIRLEGKDGKTHDVRFSAEMHSIVPVDHLQIVCNGKVARELPLESGHSSSRVDGSIPLAATGWCVLRAFGDRSEYPILDLYPYATTSPVYVYVAGAPLRSAADATYFVTWVDRLIAAARSNTSWNTEAEKASVLTTLEDARTKYVKMAE